MENLKYALWKPRKNNEGAAAIFQYNAGSNTVWLQLMAQNGERSFDSNRKINTKLGEADLGELLAVLRGRKDGAGMKGDNGWKGLYHKSGQEEDNTIINFVRDNNDTGFFLNVSAKRGENTNRLGVSVYDGEGMILAAFIEQCVQRLLVDDFVPNAQGHSEPQREPVGASNGGQGSTDDIPF